MSFDQQRELGWDDEIQNDGPEFILLEAGKYQFEVVGFERSRHSGSAKLPPCYKAVLSLNIFSEQGTIALKHNLFLHQKTEGLLSAFFTSIGQKEKGQPVKMNWDTVIGAKGWCELSVRNWKADDGRDMQSNEIKKFLDEMEIPF